MGSRRKIEHESDEATLDIRTLARGALLATGLAAMSTHCSADTSEHGRMMSLANALLEEAQGRGFANALELQALLASGLISARALELIDEALMLVPEEVIADAAMKATEAVAPEL
jgi:hypothetical protein